jgi:rSAM/selenodomain-associated transferase 1
MTNNFAKEMTRRNILDRTAPPSVPPHLCALGIMTKAPEPGKVKTRLTPPLTPVEAAEINKCFLRDLGQAVATACGQSPGCGVGVYTPVGAEQAYDGILPPNFFLLAQRENDFGERLLAAVEDLFAVGFESVCLINSDSPTVPIASFTEAVGALARPGDRVVLGPSDDGGYYLIGLKQLHRRLFEEIDWSTARVLEQTLARAAEIGVEVLRLPPGFDVDDRATLHRLCGELLGGASSPDIAPFTRDFLAGIVEREGRQRIWPVL